MRPEARPIEFTNGHAHFYGKKKVIRDFLGFFFGVYLDFFFRKSAL